MPLPGAEMTFQTTFPLPSNTLSPQETTMQDKNRTKPKPD